MKWSGKWDTKALGKAVQKYRYVALVVVLGIALMAWPTEQDVAVTSAEPWEETFDLTKMEVQLAEILSTVDGAGEVSVMLTLQSGTRRIFAQDGTKTEQENQWEQSTATVIVEQNTGGEGGVLLQEIYPQFQGALVVADGAGTPTVALELTQAVAALTGLGTDKISICKGK